MYGFIHCCLEDMVLQLFGESAWREILNISGIKLRGASFLMHQVYDDEMTFKLVAAASTVSGLPVEACLEAFGKHFLVYCQKNGYDQILRVLGSNLYDFLTNLDNLHDHLASIYPGMRAPSFRVARELDLGAREEEAAEGEAEVGRAAEAPAAREALCPQPLAGSMYLHYYSERAGLSPIVKGLVMAVAKEFFHTDIMVTECQLPAAKAQMADHVVLKIDPRHCGAGSDKQAAPALVGADQMQQLQPQQHEAAQVDAGRLPGGDKRRQQRQEEDAAKEQAMLSATIHHSALLSSLAKDSLVNSEIMMQTFPFHVIFDRQFKLVQVGKSLLRVTSDYWRRRCVGGGSGSLATERLEQGQEMELSEEGEVKFSDLFKIVRPKIEFTFDAIAAHTNQVFVVKTRPLVLNADFRRRNAPQKRHSGSSSGSSSIGGAAQRPVAPPMVPTCPMDRLAAARRRSSALNEEKRMIGSTLDQATGDAAEQLEHLEELFEPVAEEEAAARAQLQQQHLQADELVEKDLVENDQLSLRLKGQMIILLGSELCLYLCSPRVDHLDQLMECGVKMSDFALHDRARELMLMSHTHKEDREAVKKLDQASNDLKKMDTKLRQENKRTNEVLHNIFPAKIATLLSHGEMVESESFDLVTCLYSDIIGFTKMCGSENVKPIDIVRLLNTLYLQFDNLTNIHGVFKVETIGDAYVVVGGLPEPVEDHADRCVKMGLDMVKVIGTVRSPADSQPIQMRIGIHSGPVMAGIVGIRVPRYSLFGNTTTLANQLETNGVGGKIHISDFTLKNLIKRDRFVVEDNRTDLAGIPFRTYFVTNYLGDQNETRKHEKILEEQLIKDFELMGNELELVEDDNNSSSNNNNNNSSSHSQSFILTAITNNNSNLDDDNDNNGSNSGANFTFAHDSQQTTAQQPQQPSYLSAKAIQASEDQAASSSPPLAGAFCAEPHSLAGPRVGAALPAPSPRERAASQRRIPMAESLASIQLEERLVLMDIEERHRDATHLLRFSSELSGSILAEALEQVAKQQRGCLLVLDSLPELGKSRLLFRDQCSPAQRQQIRGTTARRSGGSGGQTSTGQSSTTATTTKSPSAPAAEGRLKSAGSDQACPLCEGAGSVCGELVQISLDSACDWGDSEPAASNKEQTTAGGSSALAKVGQIVDWLQGHFPAPTAAASRRRRTRARLESASWRRRAVEREPDNYDVGVDSNEEEEEEANEESDKDRAHFCGQRGQRPSLERLLLELREASRKLEEQLERLKLISMAATSGALASATSSQPTAPTPLIPIRAVGGLIEQRGGASKQLLGTIAPSRPTRILSSNMQRMKRMDTLKRRKLDKATRGGKAAHTTGAGSYSAQSPEPSMVASQLRDGEHDDTDDGGARLPPPPLANGAKPAPEGRNVARRIEEESEGEEEEAEAEAEAEDGGAGSHEATGGVAPSDGEREPMGQRRPSSNYNYQSFRASLAGLFSELGAQSRRKFGSSPLVARLAAPFGSPVAFPDKGIRSGCQSHQVDLRRREQSLQSSSSGEANASRRITGGSGRSKRGSRNSSQNNNNNHSSSGVSNCSCLKSSASSQSFDSTAAQVK